MVLEGTQALVLHAYDELCHQYCCQAQFRLAGHQLKESQRVSMECPALISSHIVNFVSMRSLDECN